MSSQSIVEALDHAAWRGGHWRLFSIVSLTYLLDGVMFSIAPLVVFIISPEYYPVIFAANLLAETLGAIVLGMLADRVGRRPMFTAALVIEVAALTLLFFLYTNTIALAVLTSLMTFGIGGEFGAAYSAIAEFSPKHHRGKALMLATNFWNVGAAMIAGLALVFAAIYEDAFIQVEYLLASALGTLVVVGLTRVGFPESPRWLLLKGRESEAVRIVERVAGAIGEARLPTAAAREVSLGEAIARYWFRLIILAVITVAQYVTYGMMAYYAPYASGFAFGVESAPLVIFTANLGASIGAFLLIPLIDRARRLAVLLAFAGGFAGSLAVMLAHTAAIAAAFYTALFITLIFSEWAWASLSTMQSELFPTGVRASLVGFLTSLTGVSGALVALYEAQIAAHTFLLLASVIWLAGLLAALAWRVRGVESAGRSVEELEIAAS
ncbi:MAG: MFS transporter [Aigarchaeota archaeon]|nr:MFS transporter [Candidatus Pelearchaeum maunauluense]